MASCRFKSWLAACDWWCVRHAWVLGSLFVFWRRLTGERDGYQRAGLGELLKSEKRRSVVKDGGTATATFTATSAEYPALPKEVCKRADITKPRNLVNLAKDLSVCDMEKLPLAGIKVNENATQALARQRSFAVK